MFPQLQINASAWTHAFFKSAFIREWSLNVENTVRLKDTFTVKLSQDCINELIIQNLNPLVVSRMQ